MTGPGPALPGQGPESGGDAAGESRPPDESRCSHEPPPGDAPVGARGRTRRAAISAGVFAIIAILPPIVPTTFGAEPTLYEKLAAAQLIVHGRCESVGRRASVQVLEVFKGSYPSRSLQVAFRTHNLNRAPGSPKIEFLPGMESILVLEPEKDEQGRAIDKHRFQIAGGVRGKVDLPAEGSQALLEAARRLAAIQKLKDQREVWAEHRRLVAESNPYLVRVGFEEVLKFRLGDESLVSALLSHLVGPRPEFRKFAVQVIGQMFQREQRTGNETPSNGLLVSEVLARATGDEYPDIRAEAVRSLKNLKRPSLSEAFEQLAAKDPSQQVRYEAEVALRELRTEVQ